MTSQLLESYATVVQAPMLLRDPEDECHGRSGDSRTRETGPGPSQPSRRTGTATSTDAQASGAPSSASAPREPRLRDQLIEVLRVRHYSPRTTEAYVHWNARFVSFHGNRPPAKLGKREVEQFLTIWR